VYYLNAGVEGLIDGVHTYICRFIDCACFRVQKGSDETQTATVDFCIEPTIDYLSVPHLEEQGG
jgi:hypothetical protein